jgi:hypothetical protein
MGDDYEEETKENATAMYLQSWQFVAIVWITMISCSYGVLSIYSWASGSESPPSIFQAFALICVVMMLLDVKEEIEKILAPNER